MRGLRTAGYLVTGGCGFIGSHLVHPLLDHGHQVRILDDRSTGSREVVPAAAALIIGDIADRRMVKRALGACLRKGGFALDG